MNRLKLSKFIAPSLGSFLLLTIFLFFNIAAFSQDYKVVKAQSGDGIYSLLKRYGLSPSEYLNPFIELNREKLGKGNSLIVGRTYRLPVESVTAGSVSGATRSYSIFGNKYKDVTIKDNQLDGAVYYLVSGHGGPDPGAIGTLNNHILCEDEYAYDVTLRLARNLIEHGAIVYMITRDTNDGIRDENYLKADKDERCYPNLYMPRNQTARLRQRKDAVNSLYMRNKGKFQRLVIIHVDSRSRGENIDVFFYHDKRSTSGRKMAYTLQQTFADKYAEHQPSRGYQGSVSTRNLYVLKYSYPVAVFIELGNINHYRDQLRFIIPDNRQALANWLSDGLVSDYKHNR